MPTPTASSFSSVLHTQIAQTRICAVGEQNAIGSKFNVLWVNTKLVNRVDLLWEDFLRVGNDEGEAKKFHRRWGALKICSCGKRIGACRMRPCVEEFERLSGDGGRTAIEPYSRVCRLSSAFNALIRIKEAIDHHEKERKTGSVGNHQLWQDLEFDPKVKRSTIGNPQGGQDSTPPHRLRMARIEVGYRLNEWLWASELNLTASYASSALSLRLTDTSFGSVFPQLVMCLASALNSQGKTAICSHCRNIYPVSRAPKPKTFNVCDNYDCRAEQNRRNQRRFKSGKTKKKKPRPRVSGRA